MLINSPSIDILACNDFEYTYTFLKRMPYGLSSKLMNTFVLPQAKRFDFDGPQMVLRIKIGSMFPCLRISFSVCTLLLTLVTLIVCDCRTNFISSSFMTLITLRKTTSRMNVFIITRKAKLLNIQNASYRVGQL